MSGVAGVELKYAIKKATTWHTPVACGADDGILLLPTGISRSAAIAVDDSQGLFWSVDGTPGEVKLTGDLPGYLRFDGCDLLLALFMGTAGAPTLSAGASAAYDYVMDLADNTDGLFCTFARWMKNYVAEVPGLKVSAITISGTRGKPLSFKVTTIGSDLVTNSVTNTLATFDTVTIREQANRIQFAQGIFRMNDQGASALGIGDAINPSSFELSATRNLQGVYSGQYVTEANGNAQDLIDEPTNNGMPTVTLKLQFPRHTSATYLDQLGSDTRKKMDMVFTGADIEAGIPRLFRLEFPHLQLQSVDVVDAAGIITEPLQFLVHAPEGSVAGMTTITKPFRISGTNQLATDPLA